MPDILHFDAILPEPPQGRTDIVNGQLTVQIGDQEPIVVLTEKGQRSVTGLSGPQGATVTMSFVYVDDSGNMSQNASVLTETLKDTVPPPAPGAMGMAITGETHEPASPSEQPAPTSPSEQPEPTSPSQPPEG